MLAIIWICREGLQLLSQSKPCLQHTESPKEHVKARRGDAGAMRTAEPTRQRVGVCLGRVTARMHGSSCSRTWIANLRTLGRAWHGRVPGLRRCAVCAWSAAIVDGHSSRPSALDVGPSQVSRSAPAGAGQRNASCDPRRVGDDPGGDPIESHGRAGPVWRSLSPRGGDLTAAQPLTRQVQTQLPRWDAYLEANTAR